MSHSEIITNNNKLISEFPLFLQFVERFREARAEHPRTFKGGGFDKEGSIILYTYGEPKDSLIQELDDVRLIHAVDSDSTFYRQYPELYLGVSTVGLARNGMDVLQHHRDNDTHRVAVMVPTHDPVGLGEIVLLGDTSGSACGRINMENWERIKELVQAAEFGRKKQSLEYEL